MSYLTDRSQFVGFNGATCNVTSVLCGVPQGSVLGPVLFLPYVVEVIQLVKDCGFCPHAFTDDLQVYGHTLPTVSSKLLLGRLAACIERVQAWMASNRLLLNTTKTEFIWLGSTRRLQTCTSAPLYVSGASILPSQRVRDLGVILDAHRSRQPHRFCLLFPLTPAAFDSTISDGRHCTRHGSCTDPPSPRLL